MPSLTNFLGTPPPGQEYRAGLAAPPVPGDPVFEAQMRWVCERYATRSDQDPGSSSPTMPSGLLYLAQFVAHDMVETAPGQEMWRVGQPASAASNRRSAMLELDTLYGNPVDPSRFDGTGRFILGRATVAVGCPFRDVPRQGRAALLADGRNDDHVIIAQLAALFMRLHNTLADRLPPAMPPAQRLQTARTALTLLYRGVVRHELLPRLLAPEVAPAYLCPTPINFAGGPLAAMPVEFSHAAFRVGHVMPRYRYRLNPGGQGEHPLHEVLTFTSFRRNAPGYKPFLDDPWRVDWSLFFDAPGVATAANRTHLIAPAAQSAFQLAAHFTDETPPDPRRLLLCDLLSCGIARPWSVPALITHIATLPGGAALLGPWLAGSAWSGALSTWLGTHATDPAVAAVVADPPLAFFLAYEAAEEIADGQKRDGTTLGTLGSIIVAEVLCRALEQGPNAVLDGTDIRASLTALDPGFAAIAAPLPAHPAMLNLVGLLPSP